MGGLFWNWEAVCEAHGYYDRHILPSAFLMLFQASRMSDPGPLKSLPMYEYEFLYVDESDWSRGGGASLAFIYLGQA